MACLLTESATFRSVWQNRLEEHLLGTARTLGAVELELLTSELLESSRHRARLVASALREDSTTLAELFAPMAERERRVTHLLPSEPDPGSVLRYSEQLFRDWIWGGDESRAALAMVERLAGTIAGKVVVLGVGTGRLALDLARAGSADLTLGLDLNPLPLLVLARLLKGESVTLHEYPLAPTSGDTVAVRHVLRAPFAAPERTWFAIADARRPPLARSSMDLVVTPWFLDAVGAPLSAIAAAVNRVLRPGGLWVNFGPLRFEAPLAHQYAFDEVLSLVERASFSVQEKLEEDVPYVHSPYSGARRIDRIFAFSARKSADTPELVVPDLYPKWLTDPEVPIPPSQALALLRRKAVAIAGLSSMIDGSRSVRTLARELAVQWRAAPEELELELLGYLSRLLL